MRKATLQSYYNYYPYGMLHPSRIYNENTYDFGFNGMLMDNQIPDAINASGDENVGANYTADFWQYDSRLGRRWNVDPIDKPWESSYACFNNNPIYFADPSGLDVN